MFKLFLRDRYMLLLLLTVLLLRLFSLNEAWVEQYYTIGFYPLVSGWLRVVFGWLPFSIGDVLYMFAGLWLVKKAVEVLILLKQKKLRRHAGGLGLRRFLKGCLVIYLVFALCWGMNYYRQGIPAQMALKVQRYSVQDLFEVTLVLQQRLNAYAEKVDSLERLAYNDRKLFEKAVEAYAKAETRYPFLKYRHLSIKPSLFTPIGKFVGFTGYYNPFTAEAQLKGDIPVFLKPFVVTHEMAHQLGYAKENEASFAAYLACKASTDINFLYAAYFELYRDAFIECRHTSNKEMTEALRKNVHPRVQYDWYDLQAYLLRNQNFIEPLMTSLYDRYLKLNNQPKGKATYDEVIAYLIAYIKKYGKDSI